MIRKVIESDIPEILELYKVVFELNMTKKEYDYWFYNSIDEEYGSLVFIDENKIVGHNAIIKNEYSYKGKTFLVGLSAGGMVLPEKSGIFYKILNTAFSDFNGDLIIAFPNENSIGFFKRIFNFESQANTYFTLENSITSNQSITSYLERAEKFIEWRINQNPIHNYKTLEYDDGQIIYKIYGNNELDIIYASEFGKEFIEFVNTKSKEFDKINIVHWKQDYMYDIGFVKANNYNEFVYKDLTESGVDFEFQMIDSDVF
ncbi:MAG: GNAT family N-acetyltransferase [Balneolaceae bacterium]|nr:GNAT family N-acetyltransferase [Balneolaceae bacterium]